MNDPTIPNPMYRQFFKRTVEQAATTDQVRNLELDWRQDPSNPEREYQFLLHKHLNYAVRWAIHRVGLPSSVRTRVADFLKSNPDEAKPYLPIIFALETNNPAILHET